MDISSISIAGNTGSEKITVIFNTALKKKGVNFNMTPAAGGHIMLTDAARNSRKIRI